MSNEKKVEKGNKNFLSGLFRQQIFIPIAALIILAVFNLIADPSFFKITLGYNSAGDPVLSGYLMTILDYGSELAILAIGMTLVTAASGGQDISVGAAIAIAGSVILRVLCGTNSRPDTLQAPIIVAFLVACVVAMLFGAFNGALVAYFKIQPMVATLILYTAGRSIAAWINNNELPIVSDPTFSYFGGFIPGIPIPTPFFIAAVCVLVIFLVLKFTVMPSSPSCPSSISQMSFPTPLMQKYFPCSKSTMTFSPARSVTFLFAFIRIFAVLSIFCSPFFYTLCLRLLIEQADSSYTPKKPM